MSHEHEQSVTPAVAMPISFVDRLRAREERERASFEQTRNSTPSHVWGVEEPDTASSGDEALAIRRHQEVFAQTAARAKIHAIPSPTHPRIYRHFVPGD